jgi:hypothetical protein
MSDSVLQECSLHSCNTHLGCFEKGNEIYFLDKWWEISWPAKWQILKDSIALTSMSDRNKGYAWLLIYSLIAKDFRISSYVEMTMKTVIVN